MIAGHLLSRGIHVRQRLRDGLARLRGFTNIGINPAIFRRSYSVPGPNFLWHIDGNHKLIKYRLVIHGGIDGFLDLLHTLLVQATTELTLYSPSSYKRQNVMVLLASDQIWVVKMLVCGAICFLNKERVVLHSLQGAVFIILVLKDYGVMFTRK